MNIATVLQGLIETLYASEECFRAAGRDTTSPELKSRFHDWASERRKFSAVLESLAHSFAALPETNGEAGPLSLDPEGWKLEDPWQGDEAILLQCERTELATLAAYEQLLHQPALGDRTILLVHDQYLQVRAACEDRIALRRDSLASV